MNLRTVWWVVALGCFAAGARGADFDTALAEAAALSAKDPKAALAKLEPLLKDTGGDPEKTLRVRQARLAAFISTTNFQPDAAVAEAEEVKKSTNDPKLQDSMTITIARTYARVRHVPEILQCFDTAVQQAASDKARAANLLMQEATILSGWAVFDYDGALRVLGTIKTQYASETAIVLGAEMRSAELMQLKGDHAEAVKQAKAVLQAHADLSVADKVRLWTVLNVSLQATKSYDEARAVCEEAVTQLKGDVQGAEFALSIGKILLATKDTKQALPAFRRVLLDYPTEAACSEAMKNLFIIHRDSGDFNKALVAALRCYCSATTTKGVEDAISCVTQAVRGVDGNMLRVNAFLKFQKYGPAGPDKVAGSAGALQNPLASFFGDSAALGPDADEGALVDAAVVKLGVSPAERRAKAFIYLHFGKVHPALSELKHLFLICECDEKGLKAAADDLAIGLRAYQGHVFGAEQFFEFQTYGPKGKDGKSDLKDPLQGF